MLPPQLAAIATMPRNRLFQRGSLRPFSAASIAASRNLKAARASAQGKASLHDPSNRAKIPSTCAEDSAAQGRHHERRVPGAMIGSVPGYGAALLLF
jgi:hypothetical protein